MSGVVLYGVVASQPPRVDQPVLEQRRCSHIHRRGLERPHHHSSWSDLYGRRLAVASPFPSSHARPSDAAPGHPRASHGLVGDGDSGWDDRHRGRDALAHGWRKYARCQFAVPDGTPASSARKPRAKVHLGCPRRLQAPGARGAPTSPSQARQRHSRVRDGSAPPDSTTSTAPQLAVSSPSDPCALNRRRDTFRARLPIRLTEVDAAECLQWGCTS